LEKLTHLPLLEQSTNKLFCFKKIEYLFFRGSANIQVKNELPHVNEQVILPEISLKETELKRKYGGNTFYLLQIFMQA